jgi:hypothetical protein
MKTFILCALAVGLVLLTQTEGRNLGGNGEFHRTMPLFQSSTSSRVCRHRRAPMGWCKAMRVGRGPIFHLVRVTYATSRDGSVFHLSSVQCHESREGLVLSSIFLPCKVMRVRKGWFCLPSFFLPRVGMGSSFHLSAVESHDMRVGMGSVFHLSSVESYESRDGFSLPSFVRGKS